MAVELIGVIKGVIVILATVHLNKVFVAVWRTIFFQCAC